VTLVAVSKTWPPEIVSDAIRAGVGVLGENRVQEGLAKAPLCPSAEWHLIGALQKNKIRHALSLFTTLHAIDSIECLHDIARIQEETGTRPDVMLEVNVADEPTKRGFAPSMVDSAVEAALSDGVVRLVGLMCIPPWTPDPEASRPRFRSLRQLRDSLEKRFGIVLPCLSMGMSGDFEVAIEEGATHVRIGTAIFGHRNASAWKPVRSVDSDSYFLQP
jgi:pyridoxal phosphate enzyme (YggS family)